MGKRPGIASITGSATAADYDAPGIHGYLT